MKSLKVALIFILSSAVLLGAGCSRHEEVTLGTVEGNTYHNEYFGLQVDMHEDWVSLTHNEVAEIGQIGLDMMSEYNEELVGKIDVSSYRNLPLFGFYKYPLTYTGPDNNPNILCVAENLKLGNMKKTIKTGADYIQYNVDLLTDVGVPYQFGEYRIEKVGNTTLDSLASSLLYEGVTVKQKHYSKIIGDYALFLIITYTTDDELDELQAILDTVQFAN